MDRRNFLGRTAFFTVAAACLGACGGGGGSAAPAGRYAFAQGVASGDPKDTSMVFWTRCTATDTSADDIAVVLEVSTHSDFARLLASVPLTASAVHDHTVRAKVTGLQPGTRLHYRFLAGSDTSALGTARTAPAASSTEPVRFAWLTCQDWSVNHWGAMELLAQEEVDFLLHVGDYIYETVPAPAAAPPGSVEAAHAPIRLPDGTLLPDGSCHATTLADYRTLYRTYRGDARLQALHARCAMVVTWDDHEFSDDCWQDHQTYTNANVQQTARRRAASQAWVEYMPLDFGDVSFDAANPAHDNLRIYRDLRFGALVHLVMTDQRLYRDDHPVSEAVVAQAQGHDPVQGNDLIGSRYFVPQPVLAAFEAQKTAAMGRAPSILGTTQTQWWKDTLQHSDATWKLWGNAVTLNRMWLDLRATAVAPYDNLYVVNCDTWNGFPAHQAELMGFLKAHGIQNVVALTGDLHAFQCGVVRDRPDPATGSPVLVDFVCAGISSASFYSYVQASAEATPLAALVASPATFDAALQAHNPDLRYADHHAQGYALATVSANRLVVVFHKVHPLDAAGRVPARLLHKRTRITLAKGSTTPVIEDGV